MICYIQALKENDFCGDFMKMLLSSGDCSCIGSDDGFFWSRRPHLNIIVIYLL